MRCIYNHLNRMKRIPFQWRNAIQSIKCTLICTLYQEECSMNFVYINHIHIITQISELITFDWRRMLDESWRRRKRRRRSGYLYKVTYWNQHLLLMLQNTSDMRLQKLNFFKKNVKLKCAPLFQEKQNRRSLWQINVNKRNHMYRTTAPFWKRRRWW